MKEKKYIPYDLSSEEDRKILRNNKWVESDGNEYLIDAIGDKSIRVNHVWVPPGFLLKHYKDAITGEPCGKLVE